MKNSAKIPIRCMDFEGQVNTIPWVALSGEERPARQQYSTCTPAITSFADRSKRCLVKLIQMGECSPIGLHWPGCLGPLVNPPQVRSYSIQVAVQRGCYWLLAKRWVLKEA